MKIFRSVLTNEQGISALVVPLVLAIVLFLGSLGFGLWAYSSRQDYKNNSDQKAAQAVEIAKSQAETAKDNEFIEREKQPLKEYKSPAAFGSVVVRYPKTWSAYVDEGGTGAAPVDGYFNPNFVPGIQSETSMALRIQVVNKAFDDEARAFDSAVKNGKAKAQPYKPANVPTVTGLRVDGEITPKKQGTMILIPLRDKTIKISTESDQFKKDFEENILPNLNFTP